MSAEGKIIYPDWVNRADQTWDQQRSWRRMQAAVGFPGKDTMNELSAKRDRKPIIMISRAKKTR